MLVLKESANEAFEGFFRYRYIYTWTGIAVKLDE